MLTFETGFLGQILLYFPLVKSQSTRASKGTGKSCRKEICFVSLGVSHVLASDTFVLGNPLSWVAVGWQQQPGFLLACHIVWPPCGDNSPQ